MWILGWYWDSGTPSPGGGGGGESGPGGVSGRIRREPIPKPRKRWELPYTIERVVKVANKVDKQPDLYTEYAKRFARAVHDIRARLRRLTLEEEARQWLEELLATLTALAEREKAISIAQEEQDERDDEEDAVILLLLHFNRRRRG